MIGAHLTPENQKYLRDAFGSPMTEGSCVVDHDRQVGYVRLELGPNCPGPDSAYWDGWFIVTPTPNGDPLRGKAMHGGRVTSSCPCPDGYCVTYVTLDG